VKDKPVSPKRHHKNCLNPFFRIRKLFFYKKEIELLIFFVSLPQIKNSTLMSTQMMNKAIADYFKTQPVMRAWLFGSFARGENRPWSDVDILVQYDRSGPIGLMKIAGMKTDLEDLLHCEVDLVEDGTLRPWAVDSVNKDRKLIYERA
jgi:hypothetical protein